MRNRRRGRLAAAAALVICATPLLSATPAHAAEIFTVYLAPDGSDANDGLAAATPVRSLVRVQEVLVAAKPTVDVEVRVKQGTYTAPPMHTWRFYVPGHTISFLPVDYEYGEGQDGIAGRPVFRNQRNADGSYPSGYWLQPRLPRDPADPLYGGGASGLRFYYLQVEYYSAGGISIYGDSERDVTDETYDPPLRVRAGEGLNGNTVFGMVFTHLGSRWTGGSYGYGAIVLTNSSGNRIENNHFVNVENASPDGGYIHGLYVTHFSSSNQLNRNAFSYVSGDPVKIRNMSNYNTVEYNTFSRTGRASHYRDEFCDTACARANGIERQCASYHNRFFNNTLGTNYAGTGSLPTWSLSPDGLTNAGGTPCAIPAGDQRLRTGYNG
ncbi:right-handed parallel beta-helix repeat-containing protein [Micromonospora sp. NPDC049559]|uniref:right-handed parallel beta-helix repeat-containing protein n=1 Tax=Micromonospora sp. NPDC049559 TaxID=3155923 RepID=UPI003443EC98